MALSSSSLALIPKVTTKNGNKLVNENIDERILRILGLEQVFDIDYDTYASLLRERMAASRMKKQSLATEEVELITNEWKRVKGKKGRFKVKKITAASFKKGSAIGINLNKNILKGVKPLALPPVVDKITKASPFEDIVSSLNEVVGYLKNQNKLQKDANERARKEREASKRASTESRLEKGFSAAIRVAEKVLAPVKSFLSRIIDFFMAIFWGKVFLKLLDWFSDPSNKKKIDSIFRFLNDHWPKLLALYLRFGTGLGRFVGGLTKLVFFGTRKLLQVVAQLLGAKAAARFLGGRGGKLVSSGLQVATTVGTTMALSSGIEQFVGKEETPKVPKYFGGGLVNMFKGLKGFFGGGPGVVSGQKGVDKIPAMLSDGEFVMSRGAVQKYGVNTLEAMNASGGGTNKPRMISGTTYAAGGGLIGYASDMIKGHEALSSLKPNQNYYVTSKSQEYKKLTDNTKIYPYLDSVNVPTIGWGATYYDKLTNGKKPVKITDPPITKKIADNILNRHLSDLVPRAKSKLPLWDKMSLQQKGTVVSFLYNAGPNSINLSGPYPKFSEALISGNMKEAAANVNRSGPSKSRIDEEKRLLTAGPLDLKKVKSPSTTIATKPTKSPGIFERLSSGLSSMTRGIGSLISQPAVAKESKYASGGMVGGSSATISRSPVKARNISPPSRPPIVVRALDNSKSQNMNVPRAGGSPQVPSFSVPFSENRERVLAIHGIA